MARATQWARGVGGTNSLNYFGYRQVHTLPPGYTILKTFWSLTLWGTYGGTNFYPPGSSATKAGLIVTTDGLEPDAGPTPVSQQADDWYDITTMTWDGNIAISSQVDWLVYANVPGREQRTPVMRANRGTVDLGIGLAWESFRQEAAELDFQYRASWSVDVLMALPA